MSKERKQQELSVGVNPADITPSSRGWPARPLEEFERMFGNLTGFGWERPLWNELFDSLRGRQPHLDVIDRDENLLIRAEVPGVRREDIDISVGENTLTISGCVTHESREIKDHYYRCETSQGSFSRSLTLPVSVAPDKASATLKDGVLEITLVKTAGSKRQTITVQ